MSNTHKVSTDALDTLGTIITEGNRDAIHLAVEPIIAGERLKPGDHVCISNGKAFTRNPYEKSLGIVDPFLSKDVKEGERFWLIVYPRQITSLRHVWSHPDFPEAVPTIPDKSKGLSEDWLRNFSNKVDIPYDDLIIAASGGKMNKTDEGYGNDFGYSNDGEYLTFYGQEVYGEIPSEFWDHVEIVTGERITKRAEYFACSC